ncbi:MAG: RtcB family protein, partial [Candidatus Latescibacteria bacterium]|nr:RtcB family protein [Candidatus Latescibacterota bacterium]
MDVKMKQISDTIWEIPKSGKMRVPGRIYSSDKLMEALEGDQSPEQVTNVAHLPGIINYSMAMPDMHYGYGFPIGGVAATDPDEGGVISPGGVGYDISCGIRVATTNFEYEDVKDRLRDLVQVLYQHIPSGVGSSGAIRKLSKAELERLLVMGAKWALERGFGTEEDLAHTEEGGCLDGADPDQLSERAIKRGLDQVGTLGSGNHFLEIGVVDEIFDPEAADVFGLRENGVVVWVHSGSRGLGYQVCDDFLKVMGQAVHKYGIELPDRQLACAPLDSPEARNYVAAMKCAANYAVA